MRARSSAEADATALSFCAAEQARRRGRDPWWILGAERPLTAFGPKATRHLLCSLHHSFIIHSQHPSSKPHLLKALPLRQQGVPLAAQVLKHPGEREKGARS
jgi:hypothetical protein